MKSLWQYRKLMIAAAVSMLLSVGCDDEEQIVTTRGFPPLSNGKNVADSRAPKLGVGKSFGAGEGGKAGADKGEAEEKNNRPQRTLTREDFSLQTRDPFQQIVEIEQAQISEADVAAPAKQREVKLAHYSFEELRLVAIVVSRGTIRPRALFVGADGKSKSIKQGEYFSRAEVLLAAINRDYIEVEVVDEDLASGLNLQQGERRAIYLKNDE